MGAQRAQERQQRQAPIRGLGRAQPPQEHGRAHGRHARRGGPQVRVRSQGQGQGAAHGIARHEDPLRALGQGQEALPDEAQPIVPSPCGTTRPPWRNAPAARAGPWPCPPRRRPPPAPASRRARRRSRAAGALPFARASCRLTVHARISSTCCAGRGLSLLGTSCVRKTLGGTHAHSLRHPHPRPMLHHPGPGPPRHRGRRPWPVSNGIFTAVGPWDEVGAAHHAAATLDLGPSLVLPGLVNAHTHASMTLLRGLADDLPLMQWLTEHIFPVEQKLSPELVNLGARLACAEMLRSGATCFHDMYLMETAVAEAADACGLRAVTGEVIFAFPSPAYKDLDAALDLIRAQPRPLEGPSPGVHGRHAPRRVHHHARAAGTDLRPGRGVGHAGGTCTWPRRPTRPRTAWRSSATGRGLRQGAGAALVALGHRPRRGPGTMPRSSPWQGPGVHAVHCPESNMKLASGDLPGAAHAGRRDRPGPGHRRRGQQQQPEHVHGDVLGRPAPEGPPHGPPRRSRPRPCWTWPRSTGPRPWA